MRRKLLEYYGPIFSNAGVVGCPTPLPQEEECQENYLKSLTYIPKVCKEQRLEKYKSERLWLACYCQAVKQSLGSSRWIKVLRVAMETTRLASHTSRDLAGKVTVSPSGFR